MDHTVEDTIKATNFNAQYDHCAKQLLSNKIILAHILKGTVEEFKEMKPEEILPLIEGEPYVSEVPVEPGETNTVLTHSGNKITGNNTEDTQLGEGKIYFDIIFYVKMRDGISQMIINVEAQKKSTPRYPLKNRAIYYSSRMLSSQKDRDFVKSNYKDILKTYSIWICFNVKENCLNHLHMVDTPLLGNHVWDGETDLLNVVLVGLDKHLTKTAISETESELHYLLGTLFSDRLDAAEKIKMLDDRFQMQSSEKIRKELDEMCNLSYIILEEGMEKGIAKGREEGIAKGREEGIAKGREEGIAKGREEGREEGMEKGIYEKKKQVICEMLLDHQPYALIKKYAGATEEEIKQIEEELLAVK